MQGRCNYLLVLSVFNTYFKLLFLGQIILMILVCMSYIHLIYRLPKPHAKKSITLKYVEIIIVKNIHEFVDSVPT